MAAAAADRTIRRAMAQFLVEAEAAAALCMWQEMRLLGKRTAASAVWQGPVGTARTQEARAPPPQSTPQAFRQPRPMEAEAADLTLTAQTTSARMAVVAVAVVPDTAHLLLLQAAMAGKEIREATAIAEAQAAVAVWALREPEASKGELVMQVVSVELVALEQITRPLGYTELEAEELPQDLALEVRAVTEVADRAASQ